MLDRSVIDAEGLGTSHRRQNVLQVVGPEQRGPELDVTLRSHQDAMRTGNVEFNAADANITIFAKGQRIGQ